MVPTGCNTRRWAALLLIVPAAGAGAGGSQIPLVEDLIVTAAARDRMVAEFDRLLARGALVSRERLDFESYLERLGLRILNQCREVQTKFPEIDPASLPCPEVAGAFSAPIDPVSERTLEEEVALLDASLAAGLSEFDEMLLSEQARLAAHGRGSGGRDAESSQGTLSGGETGGVAEPLYGGQGEQIPEETSTVGTGGGSGTGPRTPPPPDVADGSGDDVVARQLREAALNETDPELREKLWDEYRRYNSSSVK